MSGEVHHDGGRLRQTSVAPDTSWNTTTAPSAPSSSAMCRPSFAILCEEVYYEPRVTDAVVRLLEQTDVAPGRAIAVDYAPAKAA